MLDLYFPMAGAHINVLLILLLGLLTGIVSGIFGLGGGLVVVPFLTFFGLPATTAVATSVNQMTAGTLSSFLTYAKMNRIDYKMSGCLIIGGFLGSIIGYFLLKLAMSSGKEDLIISISFIAIILLVAISTSRDAIRILKREERVLKKLKILDCMPLKDTFASHEGAISALPFMFVGIFGGILSLLLGIGGGFVMIPILLYVLHIRESHISGSVQLQMCVTSVVSTILYAYQSVQVDILLSAFLIFGTVIGARFGAVIGSKLKPNVYRLLLTALLLTITIFMLKNLLMPHEVQKSLHAAVEASSSAQYIKDMAKQFPQLYTALTILLAITAGLIAGKLRNGAKQH